MVPRSILPALGAAALLTTAAAHPDETYDYIVIGSGPGGGPLASTFARAGYSTLLLEAGDDMRNNPLTKLATGLTTLPLRDANSWSFWVRDQFASEELELRNNQLTWRFPNGSYWVDNGAEAPAGAELMQVWYPRGATVGGSSVVNAMATFLPNDSEHENMRRIFETIEKNHYLPKGTLGHGFDGHFETNLGDGSQYMDIPGLVDVYKAMVRSLGQDPEKVIEMLGSDPDFLGEDRDTTEGLWGLEFHAKANWERYSILRAFACQEVIVAGGAFNSPQILQLSGIGNGEELEALDIRVIADLPGEGRNLQDNQEYPVIGHTQLNLTAEPNPNEPKEGLGPYMRPGYNSNAMLLKSNHSLNGERDLFLFNRPGAFRGISPQLRLDMSRSARQTQQNRQRSTLRCTREGAETDLGALRDVAEGGRQVMKDAQRPWGPLEPAEPPCSKIACDGRCEDGDGTSDEDWIREQTFGHHPSGTCAIGFQDDRMAVLESGFRAHRVEGLRVVDASVFPRVPGAFPAVATFMISQKASEVVLQDAAAASSQD
ncbi:GMC oxidoreductase [Colletotrichum plurivorum]|uniref:GMC oxidoreductase n=1 Tax=Colletotrichum plurivorum TaxID=2175906 RepID=A0A8H6NDU7_9PEZI|nr:GMC oxidoreductase [Colletotrichum plurivorum]